MNKEFSRMAESRSVLSDQQGAIAILVALSLTVLFPMLALVLDIGQALVVKQSLQNLADAAALAGARQLGRVYETLPPGATGGFLLSKGQGQVNSVVVDVSGKNQPPHHTASVLANLGGWNATSRTLAAGGVLPDGVQVSTQAQVPTFVASAVGAKTIAVSANATAALTGLSQVPAGSLTLPFGVARGWFSGKGWASQSFALTKNGMSPVCASWSTFSQAPATQNQLLTIVKGVLSGGYVSPTVISRKTQLQFLGANPGSAFTLLQSLYNIRKDSKTGDWLTVVPVYDRGSCAAATGPATIVGFATMRLNQKSSTQLSATIMTNQIQVGRGGGTDYGTKGSIPGLVK